METTPVFMMNINFGWGKWVVWFMGNGGPMENIARYMWKTLAYFMVEAAKGNTVVALHYMDNLISWIEDVLDEVAPPTKEAIVKDLVDKLKKPIKKVTKKKKK